MSSEVKEELCFRVKQAKATTWLWKSHLLRSVNQDTARGGIGRAGRFVSTISTRLGNEIFAQKVQ